jgi:hypothetical protein
MPKFASIDVVKHRPLRAGFSSAPDIEVGDGQPQVPLSGYRVYADFYIELKDEYDNPVEGNYDIVRYQTFVDGVAGDIQPVPVIGLKVPIGYNILIQDTSIAPLPTFDIKIVGDVTPSDYIPPSPCDINVSRVMVNQTESGSGRKDAQITIVATSGAGDIQYSLDNVAWQSSPTFNNLAGGGYIAYIKDAAGCAASKGFNIETADGLLIADPTVEAGNGNISRWSAAFNPIVFTYQRRDFYISNTYDSSFQQKTTFAINGALNTGAVSLAVKDWVYINTGDYDDVYQVDSVDIYNNTITIDVPFNNPEAKPAL